MESGSKSLLELPQELLMQISYYLTTAEFCYFRRSCKYVEKCLFGSFADEYFTKRQFMIEHESLEALVGIAHHPSLSKSLQHVIFDTRHIKPRRFEAFEEFTKIRYDSGYLRRHQLLCTGRAFLMLVEAFRNLPMLRTVGLQDYCSSGRIRNGESSDLRPWGWLRLGHSPELVLEPSKNIDYILPLIIESLVAARAQPEKLEILLPREPKLGANAFAIPNEANSNNMLGQLKSVTLSINTLKDQLHTYKNLRYRSEESTIRHLIPLFQFLCRLKSVEHLRLNFNSDSLHDAVLLDWMVGKQLVVGGKTRIDQPVPAAAFERLTSLELGSLAVQFDRLLRVLMHFPLRSFSLWRVALKADSYDEDFMWSSFLLDLSRYLPQPNNVSKITICDVMQWAYNVEQSDIIWRIIGTQASKTSNRRHTRRIDYYGETSKQDVCEWLATVSALAVTREKEHENHLYLPNDDAFSDYESDDVGDLENVPGG